MPTERHFTNELNLERVGINLPYNMQAEQSVLGAVLLKPDTLTDLVEIIRPEMFYTRQNAQIYSEMLRLFTSDQTIDFVTLLDAGISDGVFPSADEAKVYLTGLAETVHSISNVKAYAQIVQEKYLVRQLMDVAKDILQDAGDEPDADLLLDLLCNLVQNAVRAAAPGSPVVLYCSQSGDAVTLTVADTGCGSPAADLPRVTEAFYMVDKSRSRAAGGSGSGLARCARIAGAHGAKLEITSTEHVGTTVTIAVPELLPSEREADNDTQS